MADKPPTLTDPPEGYAAWLTDLKGRIRAAQQRAALAVNTELLRLYWQIGREILDRQAEQGWGKKVTERLSHDLREAFPDMRGFLQDQLGLHEVVRGRVAGRGNLPTGCWEIAMGSQSRAAGQAQGL